MPIYIKEDTDIVLSSSGGRKLLINTAGILPKTTKDTMGIAAMKLKKTHKVISIHLHFENEFEKEAIQSKKSACSRCSSR